MIGFKKGTKGQRGFTLIELLVVVAILGVLAAVVVPNVSKFIGSGKTESAQTERDNVQLAMTAMMTDQGLTTVTVSPGSGATNDMATFPTGSPLYSNNGTNYVNKATTKNYFKVAADGTVTMYTDSGGGTLIP